MILYYYVRYIISIIFGAIEAFLGLRFLLKLFGASMGAPFVVWLYDMSEPLLAPFSGMFGSPVLQRGFVFEFSTLFAMVVYALIGYFLSELIYIIYRASEEDRKERDELVSHVHHERERHMET